MTNPMTTSKVRPLTSLIRLRPSRAFARQLLSFATGSGIGLALDFGIFSVLVLAGAPPLLANLLSSAVAITTVYFLTTRYAFRVAPAAPSYAAFVGWYATSAVVVSAVIAFASHGVETRALVVKAALVPVTFGLNFLFGRWLFTGGAERAAARVRIVLTRTQDVEHAAARDLTTRALIARPLIRRRASVIASAVTLVFAVVVLPMTDTASFAQNAGGQVVLRQYALRAVFLLLVWLATAFGVRFVSALRGGSVRHRRWLQIIVASLAVNLVLLVMIWPGYWVDDEFWVLMAAKGYALDAWQGYLTNVFYTFGLYLFPSPVGIVGLQLAVIAVITGYVVSAMQSELRRPWLAAVLVVPLLSFPVLLNNQYPLRLTMYAYLLLLLLTRLARTVRSKGAGSTWYGLLGDCFVVVILAFWRTEGIWFLALLPVVFVLQRSALRGPALRGGVRRKRKPIAAVLAVAAMIGTLGLISTSTSAASYQTIPMFNVLQTMFQTRLQTADLKTDVTAIDSVAEVRVVKRYTDCSESLSFWYGGLRSGYEQHLPAFRKAFVSLVVHNPNAFLQNRLCVFENANSMGTWLPQVQRGALWYDAAREARHDNFVATNLLVKPLDTNLKNKVERSLLLWTAKQQITPASAIVWNVLPTAGGLIVLMLIGLLRRRWRLLGGLAAIVLVDIAIVFLTEPSAYFMYFFPAYLCGGVLLASTVAVALDRRFRRPARADTTIATVPHESVPEGTAVLVRPKIPAEVVA